MGPTPDERYARLRGALAMIYPDADTMSLANATLRLIEYADGDRRFFHLIGEHSFCDVDKCLPGA